MTDDLSAKFRLAGMEPSDDYHPLDFHFPGYYGVVLGRIHPPDGPFGNPLDAEDCGDYVLYWNGKELEKL